MTSESITYRYDCGCVTWKIGGATKLKSLCETHAAGLTMGPSSPDCLHTSATTKAREADAMQTQVGGDHYKDMPIQPLEYIHKNGLDYMQGNVIKYITRHKSKNGRQDVEKALHYCQLILELQYGDKE